MTPDPSTSPSTLPTVSVVSAIYNEAATVEALVERIKAALEGRNFEIVLVDDGSRDGTLDRIIDLATKDPRIQFVSLTRNFGKTAALSAGFLQASGDIVVTIDADLQDLPEEIPLLMQELHDKGLDMVVGWKYPRRDTLFKRLVSKIFNGFMHLLGGPRIHDANCGLKAMRFPVMASLRMNGELHRFIPMLAERKGFRVGEMKVRHEERHHGTSKFGFERYVRSIFDMISLSFLTRYSRRPLHLVGGAGLIFIALGLLILAYLSWGWIHGHYIQSRPLFFLGILSLIMGGQTLTIGLVMEMITFYNHKPGGDFAVRRKGGRGLPRKNPEFD